MGDLTFICAPTYGFVIGAEFLLMPDSSIGGVLLHFGFFSVGVERPEYSALTDADF